MRVFWYEVSGGSYSGCRSVEEVWLKQFTLWILLQDLQVESSLIPEEQGILQPACARSLHLIAQLSETKKWAKLLPSKSTIKGGSMLSFTVEIRIYTNVKPYTNCYQDTTKKPSAVNNLCSLSSAKESTSQIRHVSSDCDFILSASYWVFGVRKWESKGTQMGHYSHEILWGRQEETCILQTMKQCGKRLNNSRYTQSTYLYTTTCWDKS